MVAIKYKIRSVMEKFIGQEIEWISQRMKAVFQEFDLEIPSESTVGQNYVVGNKEEWTCGFWVGISWLLYENTKDSFFYDKSIALTDVMISRLEHDINLDHHDIGFLYSLSVVAAYNNTGDSKYLAYIRMAADKLIARYHEKGEFIQCWGALDNPDEYRLIIDSLLNMPLLFTASKLLGDDKYATIAKQHYNTVFSTVMRDDFTTFHTYYFDLETGEPVRGQTAQGYSNDSCWSRGQAWAIAGIAFNQEFTNQAKEYEFSGLLDVFTRNIPSDGVVYWDFAFSDSHPSAKDSSANSIVACALLERAKYSPEDLGNEYSRLAQALIRSVAKGYSNRHLEVSSIIAGSTYSYPDQIGVDEASLWGDYFYLEALTRLRSSEWKKYW